MKHVVFLVGSYHPLYSAVGTCVERVVSLLKNNYKISVIAFKNSSNLKDKEIYDGYNIRRIETNYQKKLNDTDLSNLKIFLLKIINILKFLFRRESLDYDLVNCYYADLKKLNSIDTIDVVIPVVFPFESVVASVNFKKKISPSSALIPYLFDNFSLGLNLHRFIFNRWIKFKNNKRLEVIMFAMANKIFSMHPLKKHFDSVIPEIYLSKVSYLEHPLLVERNINSVDKKLEKINFTYTGGLFRNVRSPDGCVKFLHELSKMISLKANFYCFGSDLNIIKKYSNTNPKTFHYHGMVDKTLADEAISKSDILINIGDVEGKQISSKIFDYLSMGKPIIHFSYTNDCVNTNLLRNYSFAHIILLNKNNFYIESMMEKTAKFAKSVAGKTMTFDEVASLYPDALPQKTADMFKECINDYFKTG